jgi:hypothetical protein
LAGWPFPSTCVPMALCGARPTAVSPMEIEEKQQTETRLRLS